MNVASLLARRAAAHPGRPAFVDAGDGRTLSYAELDATSARAAGTLRRLGLQPGSTVLIVHPATLDLYVALIGLLRAGLVPAIPPPGATLGVLARCARAHPPHAVLGGGIGWAAVAAIPALRHATRLATGAGPFAKDVLHGAIAAETVDRDDGDPAMLTFTSGSTGAPKAMIRSHGVARAQIDALAAALAPGESTSLCTMPIVLLAELAAGATCLLPGIDLRRPARADAAALAARMRAYGVARIVASPALLARVADALAARGETLPALRLIASGGAPVMPPLAAAMRRVAPNARFLAIYGTTEAEPIAVLDAAEVTPEDHDAMLGGAGMLAGVPCAPGRLAVVTARTGAAIGPFADDDAPLRLALPPYRVGEIVVAGAHVVPHYLDRSADAITKIRAGATMWHRTGDLGYRDLAGRLWLVGRAAAAVDDARGTLEPLRVECALAYRPEIARCAIAALDGTRILLVEPRPHARIDERAIRSAAAFAAIDVVVTGAVPVDRRHHAKVDYDALRRIVRRYAHAA